MTPHPSSCLPSDTAERAAQQMKREDVGSLPVIDDPQRRQVIGIVTDRDLALEVVAAGRDPRRTAIEDVMSRRVITCRAGDELREALDAMAQHQVRRIPVVDDDGRLVGMIAQADVAMRLEEPRATADVLEEISRPHGATRGWAAPPVRAGELRGDWAEGRGSGQTALRLIGGMALGAGLMYLLDPDRGSRRRGLAGGQARKAVAQAGDALGEAARDLGNRAAGAVAEVRASLGSDDPDDALLVQRVRSAFGRVVSHPRSIDVQARDGHVTLSGQILAAEVDDLLRTVRGVRGVRGVENRLQQHEDAGSVPALQGDREPPAAVARSNLTPAARLLMSMGGGAMLLYGAGRRDIPGMAMGALGLGLLARGATNLSLGQLFGLSDERYAVDVVKTINIGAPVEYLFEVWSDFENFPRFMRNLRSVHNLGGGRSRWVAEGPAGVPVEWDATTTELVPNRLLAWRSVPGSTVANAGSVRLEPNADGSTRVTVHLSYTPPAGALGHAIAALFGSDPKSEMDEDLLRMKSLIEEGKTRVGDKTVTREDVDFSREQDREVGRLAREVGDERGPAEQEDRGGSETGPAGRQ